MFMMIAATMLAITPNPSAILWGDIRIGEAKADVEARYPADHKGYREVVRITDDCSMRPSIAFDRAGVVKSVTLYPERCKDDMIRSALVSKYGAPATTTTAPVVLRNSREEIIWNTPDGVTIKLEKTLPYRVGGQVTWNWNVEYSAPVAAANI